MLPCLGHNAFIRGDNQQRQVNPASAGEHIVHKFLMPGHINDAGLAAIRQRQVSKAQVNGDAAALLLIQPVGVRPGQGAD